MGIIANYKYLSDKNLNELKNLYTANGETTLDIEENNNDLEILLDLDKMWTPFILCLHEQVLANL